MYYPSPYYACFKIQKENFLSLDLSFSFFLSLTAPTAGEKTTHHCLVGKQCSITCPSIVYPLYTVWTREDNHGTQRIELETLNVSAKTNTLMIHVFRRLLMSNMVYVCTVWNRTDGQLYLQRRFIVVPAEQRGQQKLQCAFLLWLCLFLKANRQWSERECRE